MVRVDRLSEALERLDGGEFDVALLDLSLLDAQGLSVVARVRMKAPQMPLLVLSGLDDESTAVAALQEGAQDYLVKGQGDGHLIARSIRYAIERKRAQLLLLDAKEKAEFASRTKSEFLANMSHELRTPLNAIIGFSEMIQAETFGPVGHPNYKEYARDIGESGLHLLEIINDLLDMSKIETGRVELNESLVEVPRAIESCLRLVAERAANGKVMLLRELPPRLMRLRADARLVKQILLNLISNAVKFTPEGGQVTIAVEANPAEGMVLTVEDNGIGIAPEDIPRAMTPFLQVESALNRRHEGTGLGLPLAKALAELHGGRLELNSELGVGTRVAVYFPAERLDLPAAANDAPAEEQRVTLPA
jgi:signal transduction histidine kinase